MAFGSFALSLEPPSRQVSRIRAASGSFRCQNCCRKRPARDSARQNNKTVEPSAWIQWLWTANLDLLSESSYLVMKFLAEMNPWSEIFLTWMFASQTWHGQHNAVHTW